MAAVSCPPLPLQNEIHDWTDDALNSLDDPAEAPVRVAHIETELSWQTKGITLSHGTDCSVELVMLMATHLLVELVAYEK